MSQEINLFEEAVETSAVPKPNILREQFQKTNCGNEIFEKIKQNEQEQTRSREERTQVKRLIEALLFASNTPLAFNKIREVCDELHPLKPRHIKDILYELQHEYSKEKRGFRLEEIADGYLLRSCEEFSPYIERLYRSKRSEKLSQAAAEVLAIIAYRQPITRPQIEAIRGVDSSGVVHSLIERGLIQAVGRLEAPGRPTLYGITQEFLSHFGINDIQELSIADNSN